MPETQTTNSPTFESVWALMDRVGERLDRVGERLDRVGEKQAELVSSQAELAASQKETGQLINELRESQKETDRIVKETAKQIGTINNRFGEIVEYMVAPNLLTKIVTDTLLFDNRKLPNHRQRFHSAVHGVDYADYKKH